MNLILIFLALGLPKGLEDLSRHYAEVKTLVMEFTEDVVYKEFGEEKFTGRIYLKRPAFMKIVVDSPTSQIIYINEDTAWIYFPEEKKVVKKTVGEIFRVIDFSIFFLQGLNRFHIEERKTKEGKLYFYLRPKEENPYFNKVTLIIKESPISLSEINIEDQQGNLFRFYIKNILEDIDIPDEFFIFEERE